MFVTQLVSRIVVLFAVMAAAATTSRADDLRNIKRSEPVPAFRLPTMDGAVVDSEAMKGSVVVVVCVSAEQRRSELAAMDSFAAVHELGSDQVKLVHVTADVVQKAYFEKFRKERGIEAPLAFDADRSLYGKLGLIVFPTTIVINKEGKLAQVISLHSGDYKHLLTLYLQHTLGTINDEQLQKRLSEHSGDEGSPKSLASAHRALARTLRQKGQLAGAKDELVKAREQDPDNRDIALDLADLNIAMGDLDGADALVVAVLAAQPEHRRAKQVKGVILFQRNKYDEALAVLEEALSLNPNPELVHYYLGQIYEKKGDSAKALDHYREALRRFVHEPEPTAATPATAPASPAAPSK
ncbi:MAG: tetratricopeptide repeat protein [Phycisphaerales bacterium]